MISLLEIKHPGRMLVVTLFSGMVRNTEQCGEDQKLQEIDHVIQKVNAEMLDFNG